MAKLRASAGQYIAALAAAASGGILLSLPWAHPDRRGVALGLAVAGLMLLAVLSPVHAGFRLKLSLDPAVTFAAALLLEPALAMLAASGGAAAAQLIRRRDPDETAFNASVVAIEVGIGALVLTLAGAQAYQLRPGHPERLLALPVAALAMYLLNTLCVAAVIGLHSGESPLRVWRGVAEADGIARLPLLGLGLLAAVAAATWAWALPPLALAAFGLLRLAGRRIRLRVGTPDAAGAGYARA